MSSIVARRCCPLLLLLLQSAFTRLLLRLLLLSFLAFDLLFLLLLLGKATFALLLLLLLPPCLLSSTFSGKLGLALLTSLAFTFLPLPAFSPGLLLTLTLLTFTFGLAFPLFSKTLATLLLLACLLLLLCLALGFTAGTLLLATLALLLFEGGLLSTLSGLLGGLLSRTRRTLLLLGQLLLPAQDIRIMAHDQSRRDTDRFLSFFFWFCDCFLASRSLDILSSSSSSRRSWSWRSCATFSRYAWSTRCSNMRAAKMENIRLPSSIFCSSVMI